MTAIFETSDGVHTTDNGSGHGDGTRLAHLRVDLPMSASDGADQSEWEWELSELVAPFVAWLATQGIDEPGRRRHRDAAERFLRWSHTDPGPVENRGRRYEHHLHGHDPDHLADARAGLSWWTDHRRILALTRPVCS